MRHEDHAVLNILDAALYSDLVGMARSVVLLGCDADAAHIAVDISGQTESFVTALGDAIDLRAIGPLLPPREASLSALARGMAYWHERHVFCGVCGAPTISEQAGYQRRCSNASCNAVFFPRIDPAVIMRVEYGDRILLGRQASWAPGMHSVLAGFVETGESLEDTVRREVHEETGILVDDVSYHSSQPWPFPSSIMLGFTARAATTTLHIDGNELESAAWFERDFLLNSPENEIFKLSRRDSIARRLVDDWLLDR